MEGDGKRTRRKKEEVHQHRTLRNAHRALRDRNRVYLHAEACLCAPFLFAADEAGQTMAAIQADVVDDGLRIYNRCEIASAHSRERGATIASAVSPSERWEHFVAVERAPAAASKCVLPTCR